MIQIETGDLADEISAISQEHWDVFLQDFEVLMEKNIIQKPTNGFPGVQINNVRGLYYYINNVVSIRALIKKGVD